jgi:hypothetical protein
VHLVPFELEGTDVDLQHVAFVVNHQNYPASPVRKH